MAPVGLVALEAEMEAGVEVDMVDGAAGKAAVVVADKAVGTVVGMEADTVVAVDKVADVEAETAGASGA